MQLVVDDLVGSTGLELKVDPGVPYVYAGFAGNPNSLQSSMPVALHITDPKILAVKACSRFIVRLGSCCIVPTCCMCHTGRHAAESYSVYVAMQHQPVKALLVPYVWQIAFSIVMMGTALVQAVCVTAQVHACIPSALWLSCCPTLS